MIIPVIMAGGVGSRLWPVSRKSFPKQFASFLPEAGSLFQQGLERLAGLPELGPAIVVCNQEHRFLVAEQFKSLPGECAAIVLEPAGRNTAPAAALGALAAREQFGEALLLILAADHLIRDVPAFLEAVQEGEGQAADGQLVTFGVAPKRAAAEYGYIRRGAALGRAFAVAEFIEKPAQERAQSYLDSGEYYWNSGMFMFSVSAWLQALERHAPEIMAICSRAYAARRKDLDFIRIPKDIFQTCPANSIDYAVMEHAQNGVVVPLEAGWNDLGGWSALWEEGEADERGNVSRGDVLLQEVDNCYVYAESRLVSLVGLDGAVVIETPDAVLAADKSQVQAVKEIVSRLRAGNRPEADEHARVFRPWGSYESLAIAEGFQVKRIIVNPGAALSLQMHQQRAEHWVVVQGRALVTVGEEERLLQENESTFIPAKVRHRLQNPGPEALVLIEVQCGAYLGEDDIVRFDDMYGRAQT